MEKQYISISLDHVLSGMTLEIIPDTNGYCVTIDKEKALEQGESPYQIAEGQYYQYELKEGKCYGLRCNYESVVRQTRRRGDNGLLKATNTGRLEPNIYVGRLKLHVYNTLTDSNVDTVVLEVLATKLDQSLDTSYRSNYRQMLEDITDVCTDLLMEVETPVRQSFEVDYTNDTKSLYQQFCFVQSFISSSEFEEALLQIFNNPSTKWEEIQELEPISRVKRIGSKEVRQFTSSNQRIQLGDTHPMSSVLSSLPQKIYLSHKKESYDTSENRFIKYVLHAFIDFVEHCELVFTKYKKSFAAEEAVLLGKRIRQLASHSFFDTIQEAQSLKLNSPTLQKRAGYREVLNRWLQFELASQLTWKGGDDVYEGGKKDIAQLYEYWVFFQLKQLVCDKFGLEFNSSDLIKVDKGGLQVILKEGEALDFQGISTLESRSLCVRFSYNRTFKGGSDDITEAGSWTTKLIPDYTLSIWPSVFEEHEAEKEDAIVHIHFDAKYKIQDFQKQVVEVGNEDDVKVEERKGTFKNVDLLKMHAYKDAIRRTGGAYILYPGSNQKRFEGFHEILPGLGAFSLCPSKENTGVKELAGFIDKVIEHLIDRTSQRERIVNNSYQILNEERTVYKTKGVLPPYFDRNKVDVKGTKVLVGYCKKAPIGNIDAYGEWYNEHKIYNFRINNRRGALPLDLAISSDYLLLRDEGNTIASKLFKINKEESYQFYTREKMLSLGYPNSNAQDYLIVSFKDGELFNGLSFEYQKLEKYEELMKAGHDKGLPFIVTLEDLFKVRVLLEEE